MHGNGERVSANERNQQRFRLRLKPTEPPGPRWRRIRRLLIFWIVALLVVNYWSASRALKPHARIRIPYSPTFLQEVRSGNVIEIASMNSDAETEKNGAPASPATARASRVLPVPGGP